MTSQQYWQAFDGWALAVGTLLFIIIIITLCGLFSSKWWRERQRNKHELAKIRLHAEMTRKGVDPDYLAFIEKKAQSEQSER